MSRKRSAAPAPRVPSGARGSGRVRIIGGRWRRRRIDLPPVEELRPTPDRVRETLFNWIADDLEGARCLDLYAGSGALGFEAASRGAARVVMVERDARAAAALRETRERLDAHEVEVVEADARAWLAGAPRAPDATAPPDAARFDVVFLDPPFRSRALPGICRLLAARGWLADRALVYLEGAVGDEAPARADLPPGWEVLRSERAGQVRYHLVRSGAGGAAASPA